MAKLSILFLAFFSLFASADGKVTPIPLPKTVRIESAALRGKVWERLTPKQKKLAFHLTEAAKAGRALIFYQGHRHALAMKATFETALSADNFDDTKALLGDGFGEFLIYAAKFLDQGGPYAGSNRKYLLSQSTPEKVDELFKMYAPKMKPAAREEVVKLLTDANYEVQFFPEAQDGTGLENSGGNLYEKGITGAEVTKVLDKSLKTTLNCRVVRGAEGLTCEILTTKSKGIVGKTLKEVVAHLRKARLYAETDHQRGQIDDMIKYFVSGDVEDFRQANIEWVRDGASSTVDFMLGWVEVYEDWLARIGSWESYVQIVDPEVSKLATRLASHAQSFEDAMPYGEFKKKFPPKYAPPAIMVYYFQEISAGRSGGYNLPNFDDIRRDVGAKNVIRLPMPGESEDPSMKAMYREMLNEFGPKALAESTLEARDKLWQVLVLLHEIIGHGSGTYDTTKYGKTEDPISALGPLGSALEEQRADLTALVFVADPILIEVGAYKDQEEAKKIQHNMYDYYLADFLRRTSGQRTFTEAHQRGHWLFVNQLLEKGAVAWATRDGQGTPTPENQVLVVKDYDKYHEVSRDLLATLQHIKAVRDEAGLKELFAKSAPLEAISLPWAQAIIQRGMSLKINAGYVEQPWSVNAAGKFVTYGGETLESIAPFWNGAKSNAKKRKVSKK